MILDKNKNNMKNLQKAILSLILLFMISCDDSETPIVYEKFPKIVELKIQKNSTDTIKIFELISENSDTLKLEGFDTKKIAFKRRVFDLKFNNEFSTQVLDEETITIKFEQIDSFVNIDLKKVQNEYSQSLKGTKFQLTIDSTLKIK